MGLLSAILLLIVLVGIIISAKAVLETAMVEAWEASRNMVILTIILILNALYIYFINYE